ncbi:hypothetical protein CSC82_15170 [Rhodobacteraceae bacterium 4F10]|nr:hypothetical protein CSC82_15170 [Rhodobacteraceae bacterium 4F10]
MINLLRDLSPKCPVKFFFWPEISRGSGGSAPAEADTKAASAFNSPSGTKTGSPTQGLPAFFFQITP